MIAPAAPAQRVDSAFFMEKPYGLDLSALCEPVVNELLMVRRRVLDENLVAPSQPLWKHTAKDDAPDSVRQPAQAELVFEPKGAGSATALALWFEADLGGGVTLTNAPGAPDTHWGQMLLPLATPVEMSKGDKLGVRVVAWPVGPGPLMFSWSWQVNDDGPVLQLDTAGGSGPPGADAQAQAAADEPEQAPPMRRSQLSRFLAELALEPDKLAAFLADPEKESASLPEPLAEALKSRDPYRIGAALFEQEEAK